MTFENWVFGPTIDCQPKQPRIIFVLIGISKRGLREAKHSSSEEQFAPPKPKLPLQTKHIPQDVKFAV